jgi:hypothetical protein
MLAKGIVGLSNAFRFGALPNGSRQPHVSGISQTGFSDDSSYWGLTFANLSDADEGVSATKSLRHHSSGSFGRLMEMHDPISSC